MLGWIAYLWLIPAPAPYRYHLVEKGGVGKFAQLGLEAWPGLTIGQYEVRVDSVDKPIAVVYRATRDDAPPVLLNWESGVSEPLGFIGSKLSELTTVATAIAKHTPTDAVVLAWWDISRQVRLLADRDTVFTSHLRQPMMVPSYWNGRSAAIDKYEREFWGAPAPVEERQHFERFVDALAADPNEGVAMLRELAGPREVYLVVHVTDIYKLGLMRPERLDLAFKNFPIPSDVHGLAQHVKAWMKNNNYDTYTLQSLSKASVRGYFLREVKSGYPLLAQLLPFTGWAPLALEAVQLIYQHGGYWVYRLAPAEPSGV